MHYNYYCDNPEIKPIHLIEVHNTKINYLLRSSKVYEPRTLSDWPAEAAVYSEGNSVLCSKHNNQQLWKNHPFDAHMRFFDLLRDMFQICSLLILTNKVLVL